jgi:HNH endonuclease
VAMAHIGPAPSPTHEVNHKDRDRLNPRVANLEWVTRSENIRHAQAAGVPLFLRGEDNPGHKLTWADVDVIRSSTAGARELARRYGVHHSTIGAIRAGRKWRRRPEIEATLTRGRRRP